MERNKNVPQIRFEGFTDDWEQCKLGEVAKEITRTDPTSKAPIMMITASNGFIKQSERYTFNNAGESLKKYILLKKGELAYNHGASKIRPYGSCFALITTEKARIPFVYHCFSVENQNPEFISMQLNGSEVEQQLKKIISSGARMDGLLNISFNEYTSISILLPKINEQNIISAYFRHADNLITLHQQKCDKLIDLKKAMLYKLFPKEGETTPEIRFDGFSGAWKKRKLGELGEIITGSTPPTSIKNNYSNDGLIWVTPTDIKGSVTIDSERKLSMEGKKTARIAPKDTILVTCIASIGKNTMLGREGSFNQQINCIIPCRGKYHPYFLLTESVLWSNYMKKNAGLSAMQIVNRSEFSKIITLTPSYAEQKAIGEYFSKLDQLIALNQEKLEKLKNIKSLLLDKMFV